MGVELTAFFTYYLLGSDRLLDATNLWYWPLAVSSLVVLAGRLGARGAWSWLAGALLFGAALFAAQSASLYIDPGFGSAVLAALAAGVVLLFPVTGERPLLKAVLFGLALGLVLGGKGPGLPYAGALGMLVAAVVLWRARFDRLRRPLLRIAVAFCVMTAVGGYWSIRNAVHTGNPLYPIQVKIGHKVLAHGYDLTGYAELDWVVRPSLKSYPPWARLVVSWTQPDSPLLNETRAIEYAGVGGLGFLWLLGALPAVLYLWGLAVVRRDRELVHVLGFLTAASLALLALTTIKWQGRYTYWMYGLGLPAMVVVLQDAMRSSVRRRWHLATLGLGLGAICVAAWESAGTVALEIRRGAVVDSTGALAYRSTVDNLWPGLARSPGFRELLGDRHVARGPWSEGGATRFGGVLALPLGQRRVDVLPPDPSDEQLDALMEVGVRWVLWTETDPDRIPIALTSRASESFVWGRGKNRYYVFNLGDCLEVPGALEP